MLETWIQWTCDGCGVTEMHSQSDVAKGQVRASLKSGGWRSHGRLDYCLRCVKSGAAGRRETNMGLTAE